jgi:hypothetical protein
MKKQHKFLTLSIVSFILSWLSLGFGYTTTLGYPFNGIFFYGGFPLFIIGIIFFIESVKS